MDSYFPAHRQPKDDIQNPYRDPLFPRKSDCAFIHKVGKQCQRHAGRSSCCKKENRFAQTRKFINSAKRKSVSHVRASMNPILSWCLSRFFPSYFLRGQYQLTTSDLNSMSTEELIDLLGLAFREHKKDLSRIVAQILEKRAKYG